MSVVIDPNGKIVVTIEPLQAPGADFLDIRRSIIHLVQNKNQDDLPDFEEYRALELLKSLELSEEQINKAFNIKKRQNES